MKFDWIFNQKLINKNNCELYSYLSSKYNIKITYSLFKHPQIVRENDNVTIRMNYIISEPEVFTHELLHLYVWDKEVNTLPWIEYNISESKVLKSIIDSCTCHSISNSIDHILMRPIYINMGFDHSKFLPKGDVKQSVIINELSKLKRSDCSISLKMLRLFIIAQLSLFESKNDDEYRDSIFECMKNADEDLLYIINDMIHGLLNYDFENIENNPLSATSLISCFLGYLEDWASDKIIN